MSIRGLPFSTVAELSSHIRHLRVSSTKLTEYYVERLEKLGPRYNATATMMRDRAFDEAREADRELRAGRYRGPLHGIPYAAKDLLAAAGAPTTWGAAPFGAQRFEKDATVVRKLKDAGAILLGKLAMVELAGGLGYKFAKCSLQGPGRNPWDPERWTGGSSSGSGAAVAAGLVPFAIGSETWGSILCPSAFCGLTGVRPTFGRVSRAGAMALSWTFDKIGPMARTAEDARMVLAAIAGPDPADPGTLPFKPKLSSRAVKPFRKMRVARIRPKWDGEREVSDRVDAAVDVLRKLGLRVEDAELPAAPHVAVSVVSIFAEAVSSFEELYRSGRVRELVSADAPLKAEVYRRVSAADYLKAQRVREVMVRQAQAFFRKYDLIVSNNFQNVAPPLDADLDASLAGADELGAWGNACGLPAVAVPCGFSEAGLPVGMQLVGPPLSEGTLLTVAQSYQSRTKWHHRFPASANVSADAA